MEKELTFEERLNRFIEATEKSGAEFDRKLAEFGRKLAESGVEFDRKLAESGVEFDRKLAEFGRKLAESGAEFDRKLAESKAEFDRKMTESKAEDDKRAAEADKRAVEADKRKAELDESFKKMHEEIFGVGQNIGYHAEQYFQNALKSSPVFGDEQYDKMLPNLKYEGRESCEFDIVLVNGTSVAIIEAKNRIHPKFVSEMAEKKAVQFRRYFPEYGNYKLYLGVAGFSFDHSVVEEAKEYGIGILRQSGDAAVESDTEHLKVY